MIAFFNDVAVVEYEDAINTHDCGEPVGDDEGGFLFDELFESVLNEAFTFGIKAAGGLVEH